MRHGGWRNGTCAKGYIEDSLAYKTRTGEMIQTSIIGQFATSLTLTASTSADRVATAVSNDCAPLSNHGAGAPIAKRAAPVSVPRVNVDSLFDSSIPDADLFDAVERASQYCAGAPIANHAAPTSFPTVNVDSLFDSSIDDAELIDVVNRASQNVIRDMVVYGDERENNVTMEQEQQLKSTNNN